MTIGLSSFFCSSDKSGLSKDTVTIRSSIPFTLLPSFSVMDFVPENSKDRRSLIEAMPCTRVNAAKTAVRCSSFFDLRRLDDLASFSVGKDIV